MQHRIIEERSHPSGGWGSIGEVSTIVLKEGVALTAPFVLRQQNKSGGFACVSCAWAKPAHPRPAEFCEYGAKATAWEITSKSVTVDFFAEHSVAALRTWSDHDLEAIGRLTVPMRWDASTDRSASTEWGWHSIAKACRTSRC